MKFAKSLGVVALGSLAAFGFAGPIKFSLHYGDAQFAALNGASIGDACNPNAALVIPTVGQNFTVQVWVENTSGSALAWIGVQVFLGFDTATTNNSTSGYANYAALQVAAIKKQVWGAPSLSNIAPQPLTGGGSAIPTLISGPKYLGTWTPGGAQTIRSVGTGELFAAPAAQTFSLPAGSAVRIGNSVCTSVTVAYGSYYGDTADENGLTLNSYLGANSGQRGHCYLATASGAIYPRDGRDFDPNDTTVRYVLRSGPKIVHVSPCGSDTTGNGFSWATAFATIQAAAASGLSAGDQIWVEKGKYFGTISVPAGVQLIGGFYGNEILPTQRIPRRYPTILDGQNTTRVLTLSGGTTTNRTSITDCIIQNGRGIPAGLVATVNSVVRVESCLFRNNTAAGGSSLIQGGGIALQNNVDSEIHANVFDSNSVQANVGQSSVGGAISTQAGTHKIFDNVFLNNALLGPGSIGDGGAIRLGAGSGGGPVYIVNNTFVGNTGVIGGAISIPSNSNTSVTLDNNIFQANSSGVYVAPSVVGVTSRYSVDYLTGVAYTGPISQLSNVSTNPQLANLADGDIHLSNGSSAYDNGVMTNVFGIDDFEGELRPFPISGSIDRGADEALVTKTSLISVHGRVSMPYYVGELRGLPVTVTIGAFTYSRLLDHRGNFFVTSDQLAPGTYTVTAKLPNTLSHAVSSVVVPATGAASVMMPMCPGDVDGDDVVSIFDYIGLSDAFDATPCDPNWLFEADLDGDGVISIFDYILLSDYFDFSGPC